MKRVCVFDTETTGLVANSLIRDDQLPNITEFYGAIINEAGETVEVLESLINPGRPISDEIVRITGITDELVKDAPRFPEFSPQLAEFIESADAVVAHNLSYDMFVVESEMSRAGMGIKWPVVRICTVEATEWMKGFRLSLTMLHEELFGEAFASAHRARTDVEALVRVFNELRERGDV